MELDRVGDLPWAIRIFYRLSTEEQMLARLAPFDGDQA